MFHRTPRDSQRLDPTLAVRNADDPRTLKASVSMLEGLVDQDQARKQIKETHRTLAMLFMYTKLRKPYNRDA